MNDDAIHRIDLLERVTLPLENISRTLAFLLERNITIDEDALLAGLQLVQADAEEAYNFLLGEAASSAERNQPRTLEQLRELVALMSAKKSRGSALVPLLTLGDIR